MIEIKGKYKCFNLIIITILILMLAPVKDVQAATNIKRLAGSTRYETAIEISKSGWATSDNIVLATGENFSDSLCATPLAKQLNAPILLSPKSMFSKGLLDEVKRLKVKNVYIIGGEGVISKDIENKFKALSINVIRLYGQDRFKTSMVIADYMYKNYSVSNEIVVATGYNFPDALSIAPIAAKLNMPIILTSTNQVPENINTFLLNNNVKKTFVIGGPAIINDYVKSSFPSPERIYGSNRYETNIRIINRFRPVLDFSSIAIATGENFPDALSGAVLATQKSSPLFLTGISPDKVTIRSLYRYLNSSDSNSSLIIFGGEGVVPLNSINKIKTSSLIDNNKISIGASTDKVYKILGSPKNINYVGERNVLNYSTFSIVVSSKEEKVLGWNTTILNDPHFELGVLDPNAPSITLGSSIEEVGAALGTPHAIDFYGSFSYLRYMNDSIVKINNDGRVIGWINEGNLKIYMGEKNPSVSGVKIGSSIYDIVEAMGTPYTIDGGIFFDKYWKYGNIYIGVDEQEKVIGVHADK